MTSRTDDVHCTSCRQYLFSIYPRTDEDYKTLRKYHYCNKKTCKEQAIADKLKGKDVEILHR